MNENQRPNRSADIQSMMIAAVGLHELFVSYMEAGFTRAEAFELCKAIMQATAMKTSEQG
jgi:hypothetical protein